MAAIFFCGRLSQIQTCLCVVVGPGLVSTSPAFMRSIVSHPSGPHGRLTKKNGNRTPIAGGGIGRHNLHRVCQTAVTAPPRVGCVVWSHPLLVSHPSSYSHPLLVFHPSSCFPPYFCFSPSSYYPPSSCFSHSSCFLISSQMNQTLTRCHWQICRSVTTQHLMALISVANTLMSMNNATFVPGVSDKQTRI